ncbi:hypothetical protein G6F37_009389 [Rhizopus arrhizus]|nr:hypothetical protein G6F38_009484 [Rhizopus arrhizus]KAG1154506.1 hypothetical protein G6F37_009389 [Rhizopus arrhizus]
MSKFNHLFTRSFSKATCNRFATKYPKRTPLAGKTASEEIEYVYGISSVSAALYSKKRSKLEAIYFQESTEKKTTKKKDKAVIDSIVKAAKESSIRVIYTNKGQLNSLTQDKPHQGIVLKASSRKMIEISSLSALTDKKAYEALIKSKDDKDVPASAFKLQIKPNRRSPFWIALDEVQDPQNFGSILRTAHFFDVDGVLVCSKNSAPLSPTVSKVSSGAMEESNENGWDIVGAAAGAELDSFKTEVETKPTILVLGNEGVGLRTNIRNACNRFISIPSALENQYNGSVDSLNVGVATGVLTYSFINKLAC